MPRVLILVERPQHLPTTEAAEWLRGATVDLAQVEGVEALDVLMLRDASPRWPRGWDWLLEMRLSAGPDAGRCVESAAAVELLADLRLLGMHPRVMVTAQ